MAPEFLYDLKIFARVKASDEPWKKTVPANKIFY